MPDPSSLDTRRAALGQVIAERRAAIGVSQSSLAGLVGVSQAAISRIERGLATPDAFVLCEIARALGATVDELYGATDRVHALALRARRAAFAEIDAVDAEDDARAVFSAMAFVAARKDRQSGCRFPLHSPTVGRTT